MPRIFKSFSQKILLFLAILGPGLITAVADNDAGGVATYTVAAALYGMASQYMVIPTTILLAITQEIGARLSIVTGKGLGSLIREKYGVRMAVGIFLIYFVVNQGVVLQNITGLKSVFQIMNLAWQPAVLITCLLLIALIIKLDFKKLQKIFLCLILFYLAYLISAFLAKPNWGEAVQESLILPHKINLFDAGYWFSLIAVLGTTITAWGQFFISSYIVDKGLTKDDLTGNKIEVYSGAIVTNALSWMMAIAVTYTLFVNKIIVSDGFSAALAIKPFAGAFATQLFAIGLFGASLLGLAIVPLATAYVFTEMFGFERTLNTNFKSGRIFYIFFLFQILFAFLITIVPKMNLFSLTLYADYLNGAMLPLIFYFLIKFAEDPELMGDYALRGFAKLFVRFCALIILLAVVITFIGKIL